MNSPGIFRKYCGGRKVVASGSLFDSQGAGGVDADLVGPIVADDPAVSVDDAPEVVLEGAGVGHVEGVALSVALHDDGYRSSEFVYHGGRLDGKKFPGKFREGQWRPEGLSFPERVRSPSWVGGNRCRKVSREFFVSGLSPRRAASSTQFAPRGPPALLAPYLGPF